MVGHHIPLLGGTTGGPKFEVLGDQEVFAQGISLAVIYTKLPLGWVFEGGFEVSDTLWRGGHQNGRRGRLANQLAPGPGRL